MDSSPIKAKPFSSEMEHLGPRLALPPNQNLPIRSSRTPRYIHDASFGSERRRKSPLEIPPPLPLEVAWASVASLWLLASNPLKGVHGDSITVRTFFLSCDLCPVTCMRNTLKRWRKGVANRTTRNHATTLSSSKLPLT